MPQYDFRKYHYRSINAATDAERAAINQELKELYASLPEDEKEDFNRQLQTFLAKEMGRLKTDYESVKGSLGDN
ncbi:MULTISPECIES: hypothetical protein [unclassified Spirosoma]|uniref:hypothetical protein n=1 Tax=unclassified Spirosoma TaxID=2621999 RepID=UPI000AC1E934|nr:MULTISPECIES: hypothetical protein [unclassified Spirosoma]MBN8824122.1 hypothetical protein [Spirosoma sp.]